MSDRTPIQPILTRSEAVTLAAARGILRALDARAAAMVYRGFSQNYPFEHYGASDSLSLGRVAEASGHAEHAIFAVLNLLSSHCQDPIAEEFVHQTEAPSGESSLSPHERALLIGALDDAQEHLSALIEEGHVDTIAVGVTTDEYRELQARLVAEATAAEGGPA